MGFFESMPDPPPVLSVRPADGPTMPWMRPENMVPGTVAADIVLIDTDQVAVVVSELRAFPNGFELALHARQRHEPEGGRWMSGGPRVVKKDGPINLREMLRFGVQFADGRRGITPRLPVPLQREEPPPGEVLIASRRQHGNWRDWVHEFWIHPLPPDGPMTFVSSWYGWGVPETQTRINGSLIRQAAERAVPLWGDTD